MNEEQNEFTLGDLMKFINYWQELLIYEETEPQPEYGLNRPDKVKRVFSKDLLITRATLEVNSSDKYEKLKNRELKQGIHAHQFRPDLLVICLKYKEN